MLSQTGERELPGERLELRSVTECALARWQAAAAELEIVLDGGERGGGAVWCAEADADRALDVLVENALRYSPRGSRVTLSSSPGRIEVRDRGPGLRGRGRRLDLRALPPRQRRTGRPAGQRPGSGDSA